MLTLGAYFGGHGLGACIVGDGDLVVVIEEERLNRIKYGVPAAVKEMWREYAGRFGYFPWASVAYCLDRVGLGLDDMDAIIVPVVDRAPLAAENIPVRDRSKIVTADTPPGGMHHYVHALSAFFASPFDRAAVLVADGDGSWTAAGYEAETGYVFDRSGNHREVYKNRYRPLRPPAHPDLVLYPGLGSMYEHVSRLLGFWNHRTDTPDAGKTMGLSAYGRADPALRPPWLTIDGSELSFAPFIGWLSDTGLDSLLTAAPGVSLCPDERAIGRLPRDIAWLAQHELERGMLALARRLHEESGEDNLCLAGGVALNSVANQRICRETPFRNVFIQPAAGDNGQAIGLAYYGQVLLGQARGIRPIRAAYGGRDYTAGQIAAYLRAVGIESELLRPGPLASDAAAALAEGKIVGWFQGGSEYGPRALGHRSILADPRPAGMKDTINDRVKFREPFRPFAPAVLAERAAEVFDLERGADARFMLRCFRVLPEWRDQVPAICHADGSARVQTVSADDELLFWRLISEFNAITGVPLILNTSFNLRGMPLVETPAEALHCFLSTDLDVLYLGPYKILPPAPEDLSVRIADGWRLEYDHQAGAGQLAPKAGTAGRAIWLSRAEVEALADGGSQLLGERWPGWDRDAAVTRRMTGLARRGLRAGALEVSRGGVPFGPDHSLAPVSWLTSAGGARGGQPELRPGR